MHRRGAAAVPPPPVPPQELCPEGFGPLGNGVNECSLLFCDGRPGIGDERCIEYHPDTGMWNDKACHRSGAVVCEWDGVAPLEWRPGDDD